MIRVSYDRAADALAVAFREGRSHRTVRVTETIAVDLDAQGRIVSLEVIDASAQIPPAALDELPGEADEMTLAEAEKESGLRSSTLRVLLNRGRLKGRKRGRDWYVDATDLVNYLESREARGRPAANVKARRGPPRHERRARALQLHQSLVSPPLFARHFVIGGLQRTYRA